MKSDPKIQVTPVAGVQTILIGDAPQPLPLPKAVAIEGTIEAPARFVAKRQEDIVPNAAHVLVDRQRKSITLVTDETNAINKKVVGTLDVDPDLQVFCINANKLYTVKELADLLRLRRQFFRDRDEHSKIMKGLSEFSAKTSIEIKDADDRKGNAEELRKRVSNMNLQLEFVLNIPIYKAFPNKTFHVEILADVTDGGVRLWLESVELAELLKSELDTIFAKQLESFAAYVVIEQ